MKDEQRKGFGEIIFHSKQMKQTSGSRRLGNETFNISVALHGHVHVFECFTVPHLIISDGLCVVNNADRLTFFDLSCQKEYWSPARERWGFISALLNAGTHQWMKTNQTCIATSLARESIPNASRLFCQPVDTYFNTTSSPHRITHNTVSAFCSGQLEAME